MIEVCNYLSGQQADTDDFSNRKRCLNNSYIAPEPNMILKVSRL